MDGRFWRNIADKQEQCQTIFTQVSCRWKAWLLFIIRDTDVLNETEKKPIFKKRDFISNYDWLSLQHSSVSSISGMDETVRKKKTNNNNNNNKVIGQRSSELDLLSKEEAN